MLGRRPATTQLQFQVLGLSGLVADELNGQVVSFKVLGGSITLHGCHLGENCTELILQVVKGMAIFFGFMTITTY